MPRVVGSYQHVVAFYHSASEYYWMSNTCKEMDGKKLEVKIDNVTYPTTEHYFQAMKFPGTSKADQSYREKVLAYTGSFKAFPEYAKNISTKLGLKFDAPAWDGVAGEMNGNSHAVMRVAVAAKLSQHEELKAALLDLPDDTIIVEALSETKGRRDIIWADGGDGSGTNYLGRIYMEQLLQLKKGKSATDAVAEVKKRYQEFNAYRASFFKDKTLYHRDFDTTATLCADIQSVVDVLQKEKENSRFKMFDTRKRFKIDALSGLQSSLNTHLDSNPAMCQAGIDYFSRDAMLGINSRTVKVLQRVKEVVSARLKGAHVVNVNRAVNL